MILTDTLAIKIARVYQPLNPLFTFIRLLRTGTFWEKFRKYEGRVLKEVARRVTHSGLASNRQEMRLAKQYPHYPIAPVLRSYLRGLVIVMPRGQALTVLPAEWDRRHLLPKTLPETDLFETYHTCRINGTLTFVDYAHPDAEPVLNFLFGTKNRRLTAQ